MPDLSFNRALAGHAAQAAELASQPDATATGATKLGFCSVVVVFDAPRPPTVEAQPAGRSLPAARARAEL